MKNIFYSWEEFSLDIKYVVEQIGSSGWFPDFVVGIKRGGLIPATSLSHIMNTPMLVCSCQLRDGKEHVDLMEVNESLKHKKLLIVDDICDEGFTFKKISNSLKTNGFDNYKTCALFYNIRQDFIVDFKSRKIDRSKEKSWIVFPWEI